MRVAESLRCQNAAGSKSFVVTDDQRKEKIPPCHHTIPERQREKLHGCLFCPLPFPVLRMLPVETRRVELSNAPADGGSGRTSALRSRAAAIFLSAHSRGFQLHVTHLSQEVVVFLDSWWVWGFDWKLCARAFMVKDTTWFVHIGGRSSQVTFFFLCLVLKDYENSLYKPIKPMSLISEFKEAAAWQRLPTSRLDCALQLTPPDCCL